MIPLLHRPTDFLHRDFRGLHVGGRGGRVHPAGRAVSRRDAAHGDRDRPVSGRQADRPRHGGGAHRRAGQRRGGHGLHVVAFTNNGAYNLTVTFKLGMDSDMAQVLVQNRVSLALPVIPPLVQNEGINVKKCRPTR